MDTLARMQGVAILLLRHVRAYGELIAVDMAASHDAFIRRLWTGMVLLVASTFALALACVLTIAALWDTATRLWVIAGLLTGFAVIAVVAGLALQSLYRQRPGLLRNSGAEWAKDLQLLEELVPATNREVA